MSTAHTTIRSELIIIGSGIAGMAATLFAAHRGIDAVQVGETGEINFASGLIDLLGVHPLDSGTQWDDPWAAIARLTQDQVEHPYAKLRSETIRRALKEFTDFLGEAGQRYHFHPKSNLRLLTPAGTIKTTYAAPQSMAKGAQALAQKLPCLLIDFEGLKGYSARQITEMLKGQWPRLRHKRIAFPDVKGEAYTEHLARSMEVAATRQKLAQAVRPHIKGARMVGFPATLGIYRIPEILADLESILGVGVFEIPTMPPAVTGLRMREAFETRLPQMGIRTYYQQRVMRAECRKGRSFRFQIGRQRPGLRIETDAAILASGRFFGKGLKAGRSGIRETIFDLPVVQPARRDQWHCKQFFDPRGHAINRCGVITDEKFRPLAKDGDPHHANLYAVGSILAHQDWMRQKCGSGLAISTALAAVSAYAEHRNR